MCHIPLCPRPSCDPCAACTPFHTAHCCRLAGASLCVVLNFWLCVLYSAARRQGTPFVDMRSEEGIFGLTLLQKHLLEQEEQQAAGVMWLHVCFMWADGWQEHPAANT